MSETVHPTLALEGQTALVTGASRGIGLEISRLLLAAGAQVAMVARGERELMRLAAELGGIPIVGDISTPEGAEGICRRARAALEGAPDILVNSAGSFFLAPIVETDPKEFRRQLDVNLGGSFYMTQAFLDELVKRGRGHIVNIGSVAGRVALPGNAAYGAAKFGLVGLHSVLAEEVRGTGVRATLVEPAATNTTLWDPLDPDSRDDLPPRASMLTPEEVARAVLFAITQPPGVEVSVLSLRSAR